MRVSQAGIDSIKKHEGCLLYAYSNFLKKSNRWDVPTIGYGYTVGITLGKRWHYNSNKTRKCSDSVKITQQQAEDQLATKIANYENAVRRAFKGVKMSQGMYDALVSIAWNCGSFNKSLINAIKQNPFSKTTENLMKTHRIGAADALKRRRVAEWELFCSGGPWAIISGTVSGRPSNPAKGDTWISGGDTPSDNSSIESLYAEVREVGVDFRAEESNVQGGMSVQQVGSVADAIQQARKGKGGESPTKVNGETEEEKEEEERDDWGTESRIEDVEISSYDASKAFSHETYADEDDWDGGIDVEEEGAEDDDDVFKDNVKEVAKETAKDATTKAMDSIVKSCCPGVEIPGLNTDDILNNMLKNSPQIKSLLDSQQNIISELFKKREKVKDKYDENDPEDKKQMDKELAQIDKEEEYAKKQVEKTKEDFKEQNKQNAENKINIIKMTYKSIEDGAKELISTVQSSLTSISLPSFIGQGSPNPAKSVADFITIKHQLKAQLAPLMATAMIMLSTAQEIGFDIPSPISKVLDMLAEVQKAIDNIPG